MTEFVRPSQMDTRPPRQQHGTEKFRRHLHMKNRAGRAWRYPARHPAEHVRDSQRAVLEHLAAADLPPVGVDVDVVREFWREHPEHRDYATRCAPLQN